MLSNLLPGLRELRAPLAAGFLWLLVFFLAFEEDFDDPTGIYASLDDLREELGPAAQGAALAFVAYLVGSLADAIRSLPFRLRRVQESVASSLRENPVPPSLRDLPKVFFRADFSIRGSRASPLVLDEAASQTLTNLIAEAVSKPFEDDPDGLEHRVLDDVAAPWTPSTEPGARRDALVTYIHDRIVRESDEMRVRLLLDPPGGRSCFRCSRSPSSPSVTSGGSSSRCWSAPPCCSTSRAGSARTRRMPRSSRRCASAARSRLRSSASNRPRSPRSRRSRPRERRAEDVRVIAGRYRGRRLQAPPGEATRPTSDRVREALFSVLAERVIGARVLDLFAGSGALGIEALSRGAAEATFVDTAPAAIRAVRANLEALGVTADVRRADARRVLGGASAAARQYDLVFLDPPYRLAGRLGDELTAALPAVLAPGSAVVAESDRRAPLELGLPILDERRYGDTLIRIHGP